MGNFYLNLADVFIKKKSLASGPNFAWNETLLKHKLIKLLNCRQNKTDRNLTIFDIFISLSPDIRHEMNK